MYFQDILCFLWMKINNLNLKFISNSEVNSRTMNIQEIKLTLWSSRFEAKAFLA